MPKQNTYLLFLALGIGLAISLSLIFAWTEPTANPPGDNVPAPLNVSGKNQTKVYVNATDKGALGIATNALDLSGPPYYGLNVGTAANSLGVKVEGTSYFPKGIFGTGHQAGSPGAPVANALGVVTGLNADFLDGLHASDISAGTSGGGPWTLLAVYNSTLAGTPSGTLATIPSDGKEIVLIYLRGDADFVCGDGNVSFATNVYASSSPPGGALGEFCGAIHNCSSSHSAVCAHIESFRIRATNLSFAGFGVASCSFKIYGSGRIDYVDGSIGEDCYFAVYYR